MSTSNDQKTLEVLAHAEAKPAEPKEPASRRRAIVVLRERRAEQLGGNADTPIEAIHFGPETLAVLKAAFPDGIEVIAVKELKGDRPRLVKQDSNSTLNNEEAGAIAAAFPAIEKSKSAEKVMRSVEWSSKKAAPYVPVAQQDRAVGNSGSMPGTSKQALPTKKGIAIRE